MIKMHSTPRALVEIGRVNDPEALRMVPGTALVARLAVLSNPARLHPFNPCPWGHTHLLKHHASNFIPPTAPVMHPYVPNKSQL